ncbi:MAG: alkaline phosphatase [Verrucomicrobia bacterium]|nr:alkaline phosphatase [Verrucomicrobiota bacterium]
MSAGAFSLADQFKLWKEERHTHWGMLYQQGRGRFGIMDTASRNNRVTDSAAASSAWGCGHRVDNGRINMGPNGEAYKPILAVARDAGKATGLVTTATVTHATPAGFAANVDARGDQRTIMEQYLERDYDLLMGGGFRFVRERGGNPSLVPKIEAGGYEYVRTRKELLESERKDPRLIGLFSGPHLPFEVDRLHGDGNLHETVPSLAEMSEVALRRLSSNPNGFLLQIEGARVDHAAHRNDTGGLLFDQLAFDDAVGVALKFAEERDDTLVIVTTDHGNASPGMSNGVELGNPNFLAMDRIRGSFDALTRRLDKEQSAAEVVRHIDTVFGTEISEEHAEHIVRHMRGEFEPAYSRHSPLTATLAKVMANYHDFGWIGNQHTAEYVYLNAIGPGSERVKPFTKNYEMFGLMVAAAGMERWV